MQTQESDQLDCTDAFDALSDDEVQKWIDSTLEPPNSFGYSGDNDQMFETWSLGPTIVHRDSPILDQSNARSIIKHLEGDKSLEGEWCVTECNHWAVGWVKHLSFRVVDEGKKLTRVARIIKGIYDALSDYPVFDEGDFGQLETETTIENIEQYWRKSKLIDDPPDDWASQMFSWFWENDESAVENCDGQGGYPSDEQFERAASALGFWDTSEE